MDKNKKNTCMACSCPCDEHKEHNHPVGEKQDHKEKQDYSGGSCCN